MSDPEAPPPPRAAAVDALEEEIVLGLLHPRERLREDELMQRFDVKRHVARAMLDDLVAMGLVEKRLNVGALVREYTAAEVRELYEVRELLEMSAAASITSPVPKAALAELHAIQAEHDSAVESQDRRRVFRSNLQFHERFFALSPNRVLVEAVNVHARRAHAIRFISSSDQSHLEQSRREHRALLQALEPLDSPALQRLCAAHLRPSRDAYLARAEARDRLR